MRFPIRFTGLNRAMAVLGIRPSGSYLDVEPSEVRVRMGWAFRSAVPRSSVRSAAPDTARVLGWGAHGWRGEWLVNGSSDGVVRIEIDPPAPGRLFGLVPLKVRTLRVAVEDPSGLVEALDPA